MADRYSTKKIEALLELGAWPVEPNVIRRTVNEIMQSEIDRAAERMQLAALGLDIDEGNF